MYVFNRDQIRPPDSVLAESFSVPFTMTADNFILKPKYLRDWAREHCESFLWWELAGDRVLHYYFAKEPDATAFRLKWL